MYVPADTVIKPERNVVPLDISIAIPSGFEGQIRPRSGFSAKGMEGATTKRYDADVLLGTIDSDYRGVVGVLVKSNETEPFTITQGTRIAQLVIAPYHAEEMEECDELDNTERGAGGYGHTGTK